MGDEYIEFKEDSPEYYQLNKLIKKKRIKTLLNILLIFGIILFITSLGMTLYYSSHNWNKHEYVISIEYYNGDKTEYKKITNCKRFMLSNGNLMMNNTNMISYVRRFDIISDKEIK